MSAFDSKKVIGYSGAELLSEVGIYLDTSGETIIKNVPLLDYNELETMIALRGEVKSSDSFSIGQILEPNTFNTFYRDPIFNEAARIVVMRQNGSTPLIQRKLKIGYNRAARIMDQLEAAGIVEPFEGTKNREVLILDEYSLEELLGTLEHEKKCSLTEHKSYNSSSKNVNLFKPEKKETIRIQLKDEKILPFRAVNGIDKKRRAGFWAVIFKRMFS